MKSAGTVLRELDRDVDSIQESLEMVGHTLEKTRLAKSQLSSRIQAAIRNVALNDLDLAPATLPSGVRQYLQLRDAVEEKAKKQLSGMTALWNQKAENLAQSTAAYQQRLAKIREDFEVSESTIAIQNDLKVHGDQLNRLRTRHASVESESSQKVNEYKSQQFFQYLLSKSFGDPQYMGTGLVARLDRWLARRIKFDQNNKQLQLLIAMIVRVTDDVEAAQDKFDRKRNELESLRHESERDKELASLNAIQLESEREFSQTEKDIQQLKAVVGSIRERSDEHSVRAIDALVEHYENGTDHGYTDRVLNPDHGNNRVLLREIDSLQSEKARIEKEIANLERNQDERKRAHNLAVSFVREFKQKRFHEKGYEYRDNFNASDLLSAFLVGNITSSEALRKIGNHREQVREYEPDYRNQSSWSGGSSHTSRRSSDDCENNRSSHDRDSFSSSDSVGGGGSSTTDSF